MVSSNAEILKDVVIRIEVADIKVAYPLSSIII